MQVTAGEVVPMKTEKMKTTAGVLANGFLVTIVTFTMTRTRFPTVTRATIRRAALKDAGLPYDRQIPKCSNCGEMGHGSRSCKEERVVIERVEVKCVNCNEPGHRARDCKQPRVDKFACRNCGSSEHKVSECPNSRSAEIECKRCNELGHFAKDCPQG
ncbi:hypothetical protein BDV09DRAFT_179000 [Aspergillus tetrazonus]